MLHHSLHYRAVNVVYVLPLVLLLIAAPMLLALAHRWFTSVMAFTWWRVEVREIIGER